MLACSTASFPLDRLEIATAKVAWAGYSGVELVLTGPVLPDADALHRRLHADELQLVAVHAGELPAGTDGESFEALAHIGRVAALTRSLDGGRLVVSAPASGDLEQLAAGIRLLDTALGALPMEICLVNRNGTLLDAPPALNGLWERGLPRRVSLALDPGHALLCGWDPTALEALPVLPSYVYLNDSAPGRLVPPGEGELDLELLGQRLGAGEFRGPVCLRLENADAWLVEPLAKELREAAVHWFPFAE